ncbi:MAG: hypothetical protein KKA21_08295 [Proteobacteria bacterium]|nr:hypothetical protein [Pseudomonadota bacterium]MBU4383028.1 hypothetical protein [Pseudomonadota bacterium]MCG2763315.1 hypothetical protein [Desulfarculaceae bacterium]
MIAGKILRLIAAGMILTALLMGLGCMHLKQVTPGPGPQELYQPQGGPEMARALAPALVIHGWDRPYNRIGRPKASRDAQGFEQIVMDPARPAMYWRAVPFSTAKGSYTAYIYRVHFPEIPVSLIPFFIGAGQNMGLFVVVIADQAGRPVLVATLGTCGCYTSLTPTSYTPAWAYPAGWQDKVVELYGETLPARLDYGRGERPRLVVEVRPGEHRVMGLGVLPAARLAEPRLYRGHPTPLLPADDLRRLPLESGTTSLFYEDGMLEGHVKGAWKPWETLFIGWWCLDGTVGMDKAYGVKGNPLYTSLQPWYRQSSDLNDLPGFLKFWGWRF